MAIAYSPPLFSPFLNVNLTRLSSSLLLPFCHSSFSPTLRRCRRRPRFLSMASPTQSSNQAVSTGDVNTDADVFQLIRTHQENAVRLPPVEEIRTMLNQSTRGMLSTFSQKHEGYPSGSMVDFACDADGSPILAVSSLAVHTKDLLANPKCSLLVAKDPEDRTDLVITLHGDAIPVSEKDITAVRTAYLAKHPDSFWVDFGDFQFMRIEPKSCAICFGSCNCFAWIRRCVYYPAEFSKEEYQTAKVDLIAQFAKPVTSHMNRDHAEDTRLIVQHSTSILVDSAYMLDMDSLGFNVKAAYQGKTYKLRIPFPRRAEDRKESEGTSSPASVEILLQ
ncbi:hypothetical protein H0E87_030928 [Populus deltoides]|uniref:DUF2470 domain-containing protein n=1 Tax=Populus deltoides TaxID=3696 RepID=A0A8T2WMC4_POPDE|nr:hypothetical protein H0E87_030928 [Populus deltoides]